ncbi:MAG TPA: RQC domain-containing protein, partial [Desulfuromonadales bacterium]|nr:RQC domain-containing protein [Desulfuromonadales bacterium]
ALLGYFGEHLEQDCGNCDICLNPPERYDATQDAQKLLSCVYRVGQRFGMGHVVDVLRGAAKERVFELGHDKLSTYGIGADKTQEAWGSLVRQLVHLGYLNQDIANYSVLKLTEQTRPLLRGEKSLELVRPRIKAKAIKKPSGRRKTTDFEYDPELFEALKARRKELADEAGVPPYIVFGDSTLAEMAASRPANIGELLAVNGVGKTKMERFGAEFLQLIRDF